MKRILALLLALMLVFSLVACGAGEGVEAQDANGAKSAADEPQNAADELQNAADEILQQAEEFDSFSLEAVEHYLKSYGISLSDLEPDWDLVLPSDKSAYADDPESGYGHAAVIYRAEGDRELTDDEINAYFAKVFAATAAASDDGYNIIGFEFAAESEDATAETTLEDALGGWLRGWCFRKDGKFMAVYVDSTYDNDKDSTLDRLFYYHGVKFDIGAGLQKGWDETMDDMEEAFEEYGDEIEEALSDYTG